MKVKKKVKVPTVQLEEAQHSEEEDEEEEISITRLDQRVSQHPLNQIPKQNGSNISQEGEKE